MTPKLETRSWGAAYLLLVSQGAPLCLFFSSAPSLLLQWWGSFPFIQLGSLMDMYSIPECWFVSQHTQVPSSS